MDADGIVYAWGRNFEGQLGDGTTTDRYTPVAISGTNMNWRVATPALSVASGLYYTDQSVTVTIADPSATLRYTTTGVDPTSSDATVASGNAITVTQSQTLKVSGWKTGAPTSVVVARAYELKVVTPALSPSPVLAFGACCLAGLAVSMLWPATLSLAAARWPFAGAMMFALLAAAGDVGAAFGAWFVGLVADLAQVTPALAAWLPGASGQQGAALRLGLLSGAVAPLGMLVAVWWLRTGRTTGRV
jgi:hypothetical protein